MSADTEHGAGDPPTISVIVVTYNSARVLRETLESVVCLIGEGGEVIVVDNNSSDETLGIVRDVDPRIRIAALPSNIGFSAAVNHGARAATSTCLCLLNPDAVVHPNDLSRLARVLEHDPTIGAIAPVVIQEEGKSGNSGAYRFPTIWRTFCTLWGVSLLAGPSLLEGTVLLVRQIREPRDVDWLTGACLLIPRNVWHEIGGMTERWFMYGEDIDLGLRLRRLRKRVVVDPRFEVRHQVGKSSDKPPGSLESAWLVNQWDFYRTDLTDSRVHAAVWKIIAVGGVALRALIHDVTAAATGRSELRTRGRWLWRCATALRKAR